MFSIFCRRRLRIPPKDYIFVAQQFCAHKNTILVKSCSSSVCENDSVESFTVSYLINSCGLSSMDATGASKKLSFKSPEKPDAVLKLLREYGFTDAHISRLIIKWPDVLVACPNENLLPKLEFFLSIGVPRHVLTQKLSMYPFVLWRSLKKSLIPSYIYLKSLLQSDERVVQLFSRAPLAFDLSSPEGSLSILRERGVPKSFIATLVMSKPAVRRIRKEKFARYVDRAVEMGFDISKSAFVGAVRVFVQMTESTLKHKMEVYRRCGWSESDINSAFLRCPTCMSLSEKKIMDSMEFLVNNFGCKPAAIAQRPSLLNYNLEKRIKPRCLVAGILKEKGIREMISIGTLLVLPEKKFLRSYIVKYEKDIPELLDLYRGKLNPPEKWSSFEIK